MEIPQHSASANTDKELDTLGKRIRAARKKARYNQEELGKLMGVSRIAVGHWESGRTAPDRKKMGALAAALNTTSDWLLRGEGPETINRKPTPALITHNEHGNHPQQTHQEEAEEPLSDLATEYTRGPLFPKELTFYGDHAPGQVVDYLAFQKAWMLQTFQTRPIDIVTMEELTDEMAPTVDKDDLVVLTIETEEITENGLYMVQLGNKVVTRRLQRLFDQSLIVICDNPAYENETIPAAQVDKLRIIGRVLLIVKRA